MDTVNKKNERLTDIERNLQTLLASNISYGVRVATEGLLKEIEAFVRVSNTSTIDETLYNKIQIGGGTHYLQNFLNIDLSQPADMLCDVRDGIPLTSGNYELIFCEHFLEHLDYPVSVEKFITESYRLLKKDGELIIGVPNSRQPIEAYINEDKQYFHSRAERLIKKRDAHIDSMIDVVNYHFRDAFNHPKYTVHYWAYDEEKLKNMLLRFGFSEVEPWQINYELVNAKRVDRTIYVVARK